MGSMLHEDHEFGGPAPCLAVLLLATAEDRFSWGVLPLRVNAHYSHKYNKDWGPGSNQGSQERKEKDRKGPSKV